MTLGTNPIQWNVVVNTNGALNTKKNRISCNMCVYVCGMGVLTMRSMALYAARQDSSSW